MNFKKKIYLILFVISLIATGTMLWSRINVENQAKTVDIVADYYEFSLFADQLGITDKEMFKTLFEAGISSVALSEDSLYSLVNEQKPIEYDLLSNVKKDLEWQNFYGDRANAFLESDENKYDVIVRTYDQALFERLSKAIEARYDVGFYEFFDEDVNTIVLKGTIDDLYYTEDSRYKDIFARGIKLPRVVISSALEDIGLGYDPEKIENIKSSGLPINLRPTNFGRANTHIAKAYFDDVKKYDEEPMEIIFGGRSILGYEQEVRNYDPLLYKTLVSKNIPIALIESSLQRGHSEQDGLTQLAQDLNYNVVRVFPVIEYIQQRYNYLDYYTGSIEIQNTLYRAITERNIRAIYFRPYKDTNFTYYEVLEDYKPMLSQLEARLAPHGISLGRPSVMPYHSLSPFLLMLSAFGLLILGLIALKLIFDINEKFEWILFILGMLFIPVSVFVVPNLSVELYAFAAANIYPTIAIIFFIEYIKDILLSTKVYTLKGIIVKASIGLTAIVTLCLIGGLTVGAIMSRSDYLVEMSFYRGVKASLLLPMLLFVVIYIIKLGYRRNIHDLDEDTFFIEDLKGFLYENVKVYYLAIAALLAIIVYIYIARSGHETNVEALNIEIIFRNFLENVLLARPRTKEILMAFPAFTATVYLACRGYQRILFPFALTSMIGFTSVVNTFCHSRAPIYLSTARELISLAMGIVIGVIVLVVLEIINRIYVAYFGSKKYE
ncbi:DUF5693 family protein [Fusibacter ferrireducens]|uniref:Beta-carotene 15,15'-monooxygenase n=1 Tax=Fusibacter ferrireducens TaxID=2785058 RepID=A0ABR9ZY24_9FIRM|nr:DUF5693 family protein [Fusibacter ferrireducens]MBF4695354.1 hypothetical protein [Fusibacter ferrireducens]